MKLVIAGLLVFTACAFQLAKQTESDEAYCSRQFQDDKLGHDLCFYDLEMARNG